MLLGTNSKNNAPVAEIRPLKAVQPIPFEQLPASTKDAVLEGEKAVATGDYSNFRPVEIVFRELSKASFDSHDKTPGKVKDVR